MPVVDLLVMSFAISFVATMFFYPKRRSEIEQTCVKESRLKTFVDDFIVNYIIVTLILVVVYLLDLLTNVFL